MEYEDRVTLATPEGVDLDLTLAGLGSRIVARFVDQLVVAAIVLLLAIALLAVGDVGLAVFLAASFGILYAYDVLFEVLGGGRTLGKRAMRLRVIAATGAPVGLRASLVRNLLRLLEGLATAYVVASAAILTTARNQRLGDLAADTLVVRERFAIDRRRAPAAPAPAAWQPDAMADVSAVTVEDVATVRQFLDRRRELDPHARSSLARELAVRLAPKVSGAPHGTGDEGFLEWLAATKAAR